jgi:hypothetical protein
MKTQVIRIEPWGKKDDYCGDGSWGVSNPDDTRMMLRFTLSVPKSFRGTFDPSRCPEDTHVATGNDEDSFNSVAGDYHKSLDGKMLPGATKYGDNEYSIEKAIKQDFCIESSCGDPTTPVKSPTSEAKSPRTPGSCTRKPYSNPTQAERRSD